MKRIEEIDLYKNGFKQDQNHKYLNVEKIPLDALVIPQKDLYLIYDVYGKQGQFTLQGYFKGIFC